MSVTIKLVDENGFVFETPDRSKVFFIQTPQTFKYETALDAYTKYISSLDNKDAVHATDDAQVVEMFSDNKIKLIEGEFSNIKITNPEDLKST